MIPKLKLCQGSAAHEIRKCRPNRHFDPKKYTCIFSAKCDIIVSTSKDKTDTGCKQLQEPAQNPLCRENIFDFSNNRQGRFCSLGSSAVGLNTLYKLG